MSDAAYRRTTRSIEVAVQPFFLDDESEPAQHRYVWAYKVHIANRGNEQVTLRMRHWRIVDANGHLEEVHGEGVVGEQPVLMPGETHTYRSFSALSTPSGIMHGSYDMELATGERFAVEIPAFSLDSPHQVQRLQ